MNTVPPDAQTPEAPRPPEAKYKIGDMLARNDEFYGTIVLMEGNYPCRFYGIRMKKYVGVCMVNSKLLDDPKTYPGITRIN